MKIRFLLIPLFFAIFFVEDSSCQKEGIKDSTNDRTVQYSLSQEEIESSRNAVHLPFASPIKIPDKSNQYSQSITTITIDRYEFTIGESAKQFLLKYPEFNIDEYLDEEKEDLISQYYFKLNEEDVTFVINFYNDEFYELYINDEFWSGIFKDFIPEAFGFLKVGEDSEFINNNYPNVITEHFVKDNIKLDYCGGRYGFLRLITEVN